MPETEVVFKRWKDAGPLSGESQRLLIDLKDANLADQPGELIWAAFVRSLTAEQKGALLDLLQLIDRNDAFRWF